jgi:hypothetical protein
VARRTPTFSEGIMAGFQKAVRSRRKLRAAFDGPAGSGKTFTALRLAFALVDAGLAKRVAMIDTENDSASLYAGESPDGRPWEFDTLNLKKFGPDEYTAAVNLGVRSGFDALVIDSLSHAWIGEGGALDLVDSKGGNKFTAWKDITPMQRRMVDTLIRCDAHVVATMRSKTEYVLEEQVNNAGKTVQVPVKKGMAPIQRDGLEYEFDLYGSLDATNQLRITKSRCSVVHGQTTVKPGPAFWAPLFDWLKSGAPSPPRAEPEPEPAKEPPEWSPEGKPAGWTYAGHLEGQIARVETLDALTPLADTLKTAVTQKYVKPAEADKLRKVFGERRDALKKAAEKSPALAAAGASADGSKSP